jgi:imidazolonepropionase-like amidohydrolase
MKTATSLAFGVGLLALVSTAQEPAQTATALHFGHLWDGSRLSDNVTVVIDKTKIVAVGTRVSVPKGATEVDLRRYTAIPGLIDLHTHITYYWDRAPQTTPLKQGTQRSAGELFELAFDNARKTLETGVTTIRDLGASRDVDYKMRDAVNLGQKVGPRMFVSGAGLSAPRGGTPNTLDQWREAVALRVKSGSDWIKVYGSRGSYQSVDTTQTLTFDEMKAIVDAAHAAGKPVAIHSYGASGVRDAVRAGADSVEHGIEIDDATFKEMAQRGTVWVPTIDHNRYYVESKDEYQFAAETIAPLQEYLRKNLEAAARAVKFGVKLGMGSDAVYTGFRQNTRELSWFVKAGLTPAQALATATTIPATLLKHERDLGRIASGFSADIVAVEGEPLKDIQAVITGVKWVMKDGKVVVDKR